MADAATMKVLEDAITTAKGAQASAKLLITEFAKFVAAHPDDAAAIQAFAQDLLNSADDLSAAVAANPDPDPND